MARVTFNSVFNQHSDGSIEPRQRIRVGGVEFGQGVRFTRGVVFGGIDFFSPEVFNHDLEINTDNDIIVIVGIY
jgi:hypothetical protein